MGKFLGRKLMRLKVRCIPYFYEMFHVTPKETEERFVYSIGDHAWDIPPAFPAFFLLQGNGFFDKVVSQFDWVALIVSYSYGHYFRLVNPVRKQKTF